MAFEVGQAYVSIVPSLRNFRRDLRSEINTIPTPEIAVVPVIARGSLTELRRNLEAYARVNPIEIAITPVLVAGSRERLQRELDGLTPPLTIKVTPILGRLDRRGLGGQATTTVKADVDRKSFSDAIIHIARLSSSLKTLVIPAAIAGSIPTILGLSAALAQAAQSAALLPAVVTAGAFAFGALKVGVTGFGEAMSQIGDPEKFAEAIAKLSPAAREAAVAVRDLAPAWKSMQDAVQERLFVGLADVIRDLGERYIPILEGAFTRIAGSANGAALGVGEMLSTSSRLTDITSIGDNAAQSFGSLFEAVKPLSAAFLDVATVGSTFLPGLTAGAGGAAQAFADMVSKARETGQLHTFIQQGLDALTQLGHIAGNVGSSIGGIFTAANASGAGFLTNLENITGTLDEVIHSTAGQTALQSFFSTIGTIASTLGDTLKVIAPTLSVVLQAAETGIKALAPYVPPLAEALGGVLQALSPLLPVAGQLAGVLAGVLTVALKALTPALTVVVDAFSTALAPVLPVIGEALGQVATAIAPVAGAFAGALSRALVLVAPILAEVATILADHVTTALQLIQPYLPQIADAIIQVLDAVLPLVPQLVQMASTIALAMLPAMLQLVPSLLDVFVALIPLLPPLIELAETLLPLFVQVLNTTLIPALDALAFILSNVVAPVISNVIVPAINGFIWVQQKLAEGIIWLNDMVITPIWNGIKSLTDLIWTQGIVPALQRVWDFLTFTFGPVFTWLGDRVDEVWRGIGWIIDSTWNSVISPTFGKIQGALDTLGGWFGKTVGFIDEQWSRIGNLLRIPINFVINRIYNDGIKAAWDKIAGWTGLPPLPRADEVPTFQRGAGINPFAGGGVYARGFAPGRDTLPAAISPGESVLTPEATAFLGPRNILDLNYKLSGRKPTIIGSGATFSGGGWLSENRSQEEILYGGDPWSPGVAFFAGGGLHAGQSFADAQVGKRYQMGGFGPNVWDCSGLMSGIRNALLGQNLGRFATASFSGGRSAGGFVPGRGTFTIGVKPGSPGHMAGTLAGTNYEATPPRVIKGPGARGALNSMFPFQFYLPQAGDQFTGGGGGGGGGGFFDPVGFLRGLFGNAFDLIGGMTSQFGDTPANKVIQAWPRTMIDKIIDWGKDKVIDWIGDTLGAGAGLFGDIVGGLAGGRFGPAGAGAPFYTAEIARAAKARGMPRQAAVIGAATALVETNMRNLANRAVPDSLRFPNDGLGSDHDSVGLFQQRNSWGPASVRMNPFASAGLFFNRLGSFNYLGMNPGAAAQKVQVSAFPGRYAARMEQGRDLIDRYGGYDSGGILHPGLTLAYNGTGRNEHVLTGEQWDQLPMGGGDSESNYFIYEASSPASVAHEVERMRTFNNRTVAA